MNIYGSLMDIYDEKKQKTFMSKNPYTFTTKNTKTFTTKKKQTKRLYAPIINRNI